MKTKTQHIKTYGMQQKQGNLWLQTLILKKKKNNPQISNITFHLKELGEKSK